jgi:hypothetical protein
MTFRFTLTDPLGNKVIMSEPSGWDTASVGFERHPQFLSPIKYFKSSFQTYGSNGSEDGKRDTLLSWEKTYGPDALIGILAEIDANDDFNFDEVFNGTLAVNMFIETLDQDHLLQIVLNQPDFWAKFISRYSNQVDIRSNQTETEKATLAPGTATPTPYFNLPLPSQIIRKGYQGVMKNNKVINFAPTGITDGSISYEDLLIDFDQVLLNEIDQTLNTANTPMNQSNVTPPIIPLAKFILTEDGDFSIDDFVIRMSTPANVGPDTLNGLENRTSSTIGILDVRIQVNDQVPIIISGSDQSISGSYQRNDGTVITLNDTVVTDYSYSGVLPNLKRNDQVRIFAHVVDRTNLMFYNNVIPPGSNIHTRALFIWGTQGWDKNTICPLLGGETFIPMGFTDVFVDDRYTSLFSDSYDPGSDTRANAVTKFPVFEDLAFLETVLQNDTFIVGVPGNVGSGIFVKPVGVGDFIQVSNKRTKPGTITVVSGSNAIVGVGTLFTGYTIGDCITVFGSGVAANPTSMIGQILHITDNTHLTLAANAVVSYSGKSHNTSRYWVSHISLYEGLQAYGNTHLNVTFKSKPSTTGSILHKATTLSPNNYGYSDNSISAYQVGQSVYVQFDVNNSGAATLKINALAVLPIVNIDGSALIANEIISTLLASGTNAYVLPDALVTNLYEGLVLTIQFTNANTGASTLNVNSLGAKPIVNPNGSAIAAGTIGAGSTLSFTFDGTNYVITDTNGTVTGQVYVLTCLSASWEITPISNTDSIAPTANQIGQAFLSYDLMAGILDRITDAPNLFYSEYLGNPWTMKSYPSVGCGSLLANLKGLQVRGYKLAQKPFFISAQDWWDGINPIHGLCLLQDNVAGNDVIRVEKDEYVFDDSSMSILFSNVQSIKRFYDPEFQFNKVRYGYSKWQSVAVNGVGVASGIDDPQTSHTRNTLFQRIGKEYTFLSKWVAASLTFEQTRRVGDLLSANYSYDNDTFVVKLRANGDGTFTPELNENFSDITGLNDPETRYNSSLTPLHNFYRWIKYLSGCLQSSLNSYFTFASGEGNYDMSSTMTTSCPGDETGIPLKESDNVPISTEFLFLPMPYEINHYMDWEDFKTLEANKRKAIGISQTDSGHKPFFIKSLDYVIATGLVKLVAWPKKAFDIIVPETGSSVTSNPSSSGRFFEEPYFEIEFE